MDELRNITKEEVVNKVEQILQNEESSEYCAIQKAELCPGDELNVGY